MANTQPQPTTPAASAPPLWRVRLQAIAWFLLGAAFVICLPIVLGWGYGLLLVLGLVAALLGVASAWVWRRFSAAASGRPFAVVWLRHLLGGVLLLGVLVGAPFYYLMIVTDTRPATVAQVALTNGVKHVVFQGMQHIGSEHFYQAVIYDLEKALSEGYVSWYEGVQTSTPESKAFFEKLSRELVGGSDLSGAYKAISQVCGMKFQLDYFGLLETDKAEHPKRHLVADVDALELKAEYERLMREDAAFAQAHAGDFQPKPAKDDNAVMLKVMDWLRNGSASQQALGGVACRGLFALNSATPSTAPDRMDQVILDYRNRALAQRITQSADNKIFITYGSRHLRGLVVELRKLDPKWTVGSVKWLRTVEAPEHVEGQLRGLGP